MKLKRKVSIRQEIFNINITLTMLAFLLVVVFFSLVLYNSAMTDTRAQIESINSNLETSFERYMEQMRSSLEMIAADHFIIEGMDYDIELQERVKGRLGDLETANPEINNAFVGYENGIILINNWEIPSGYTPIVRPWYIAAKEAQPETVIGIPYKDASTMEWMLSQSKALLDDHGVMTGVIAIESSMARLNSIMLSTNEFPTQRSYIINKAGQILVHPDEAFINTMHPEISELLVKTSDAITYTLNNVKGYGHYQMIDGTDWFLVTILDAHVIIDAIVRSMIIFVIIGSTIIILLALLQMHFVNRRIIKPVMDLSSRVRAISQGQDVPLYDSGHLNYELQTIITELEKLTVSALQKKTKELQTIIESSSEGILVVDAQKNMQNLNSQFRAFFNISIDQGSLESSEFQAHMTEHVQPEDLDKLCSFSLEKAIIHLKNGRILDQYACPLTVHKETIGYLWNFRDITESQQSLIHLNTLANTDSLTNLMNRRSFLEQAHNAYTKTLYTHKPISLIMVDIDHFKRVNDTYGHDGGDQALVHLASDMMEHLRSSDHIGRLGGEEFAILLEDTDSQTAYLVAEKLRKFIAASHVDYKGQRIAFTISLGLATHSKGLPLENLFDLADKALYVSKNTGRNKTTHIDQVEKDDQI